GLSEYHLQVSRQERGSIAGTKFDVRLAHEHEAGHSHEHSHGEFAHAHPHSHGEQDHAHDHGTHHDHLEAESHGPHGGPLVATRSGRVELSVFETNVPPRFRLYFFDAHGHHTTPPGDKSVTLETIRARSRRQQFKFKKRADYLEATDELPEPH